MFQGIPLGSLHRARPASATSAISDASVSSLFFQHHNDSCGAGRMRVSAVSAF